MTRAREEMLVGLFVLAAFGVLMWGTLKIGVFPALFGADGAMKVAARFENVAGLDLETDVLLAGVPVGKVARIGLEGHQARVTLRIEAPDLAIPVDSVAAIRSRGLLGDRVIEILPGHSSRVMEDGGVFTHSRAAANVDLLVDRLTDIAGDIKQVSATFRNVLGDAEGEEALHEIVANVRTVSADLRRAVEGNQQKIERVVDNLDSFSGDLARLSRENRGRIDEMVKGLHEASAKLNQTLDALVALSARVDRGEGTLGKLVAEDGLYDQASAAILDARAALREVRRAAEETQEQIPATVLTTIFGSLF